MGAFFDIFTTWIGEKMAIWSTEQCCTLASYEPEMPEELDEL